MTGHDELVSTCRAEPLATGSLRRRLAAVDEVLRGIALQTSMNSHSKLKLDSSYTVGKANGRLCALTTLSIHLIRYRTPTNIKS